MSSMFEDVRDFHSKFRLLRHDSPVHLTRKKLAERVEFVDEELDEFIAAANAQDLAGQADALVDLVYVALGTAVMLGLPWQKLWNDVHEANMRKERGTTHRGHAVDVTKPEGWVPPQGFKILELAGYNRADWISVNFEELPVDEAKCKTDPPIEEVP